MKYTVEIQSKFPNEDEFGTDHYGINVIINDQIVTEFGDEYHDNGGDKAAGYIEGYFDALGITAPEIHYTDVVDKSVDA